MANFIQKLFQGNQEKGIESGGVSGAVELLQKIISPDLGTTGLMERYSKSLYVFACISKISEKVGSIEINLSQIVNSKGDMKQISTHPALDLIYRPNKLQTKAEFLSTLIINKKTAGDAFIFKVRNNSGDVVELWNLRPDMMTVITDPLKVIAGYKFTKADGTTVLFQPEEIIHFKDNPDPLNVYTGISALMPASIRIQTEEFSTRYQRDFFLNSARPDAVLKSSKNLTTKQKKELRKNWNSRHKGVSNSSKIGLLTGGMEYQLISVNQKDMDYVEGTKMTRDDILVAFRMTKSVLGITEDVNRANAEAGMYVFLSETIVPEVRSIIEKLNEEMLYPDFGENLYYSFTDPTPANRELQLKEYSEGITNNYLLINEVRQMENRAPVMGGWSFYMPLMMSPIGGLSLADQKKMIDLIHKDSLHNQKIIEGSIKKSKYSFKGRFMLKQKMRIFEYVAKQMLKKPSKKKSIKGEQVKRSMIEDPKIKKMYADMVNKKIDAKSSKLKDATDDFAIRQKARLVANMAKKLKSLKRKFSIDSVFDIKKETALSIDFIVPFIEEFLKEAGMESLATIAPQEIFATDTKRIKKFIDKRSAFFAKSMNNTTLEKLSPTLAEGIANGEGIGDMIKRVENVYSEFPTYRSELIARTEATVSNNEGILESFKQSEVVNGKEWITAGDDRVRDAHMAMDGEIVGVDEKFSDGEVYPSEPNCRCVLGGAFIE